MGQNSEVGFLKFSPQVNETLLQFGTIKSFKEGDSIIREDAYIRTIPIVIKGSIRVLRTDDEGREILLYYITSGETCIMSFLGGMHHSPGRIKGVAEEDVEILFIPIDKATELIKVFPEWQDYIFRLYHKRFEELLEMVNAVAFKKTDERLLDLLKKKSQLTGSKTLHVTHEQLANELGTARVVVSRLLKQMEEDGLVSSGRNKISLL